MTQYRRFTRILFAFGMVSLGVLALVYSHLATVWYSVPDWVPWGGAWTLASGIILLGGGIGLLLPGTARLAAGGLLAYLTIWLMMRLPSLVTDPLTAVLWENAAEIGALVAGAWVVLAGLDQSGQGSRWRFAAGPGGRRGARILFALSLVAFGVSHFAYIPQTARLVPAWLPFPAGWAYLTGAAHLAAGIGVLLSIYPRLAATLEAAMLSLFTLAVWIPAILAAPNSIPLWTEITVSLAVTAAAWVVAESIGAADLTP